MHLEVFIALSLAIPTLKLNKKNHIDTVRNLNQQIEMCMMVYMFIL